MIVQFGQPSPWHVGQSSRRLYSPRSVGIGISPRRCEIISSNSGLTLSYSLPSSARIGPRWNSTSSIAIFGTSAMRTRRIAFANEGSVSSRRRRIASGACDSTRIFISHPPAAAAAFRLRAVVGHRGHFLDPADPQARAGESADRGLGPGSGGLRLVPPRRAHPDVDRVDAFLLRGVRHALRGLHRGVRRGLVLRRLHDHASRGLRDRLGSRDVRERDDDVVVRRVDVRDPPTRHGQAPSGFSGFGASGSGPSSSVPSSAAPAAGGVGGWPCCRTGCRSLEIADRSSYVITFSSVRLTRTPGIVTRRPPSEELLPLLLGLLVLLSDARLQFPRPLPESPQDVLGSPEFLLVLQPVLLQELVLRLDALRLPRMGRPLELRTRELRVAQRLTPWPVPSSLPSFLPSSLPSCRLPRPSSPWRLRGRPSS